jgi:putative endopeptidase
VRRMLQFTGNPGLAAAAKAETILTIETELANGSVDRVALRDPHQRYHKLTLEELSANSPHFDWARYVAARHLATLETLDVEEPEFVKAMDKVVRNHSLEDLKTYLVWQTLSASVNMLPHRFVDEDFEFYGKRLHGAKQLRPRWERCIESTDNDLGNDLGVAYVARTFGEEGKQHTLQMVSKLENALRADIEALPWMGEETKREALVKLTAITNRIGYPDQWRNKEGLEIVLGDALGNSLRAREFDSDYRLGEIGKVPDKNDWPFTVPTVDAQEDPQTNALTFPAGILQPPFFDSFMDTAFNFGASGAVIGHELTHGFDDEGRQFDAKGNLRNWWTKADAAEFTNRAQCLVEEYGDFVAFENTKVDGRLTLGENVADNAGLRIALMALRDSDAESKTPKDGFTPEQRFFLGWGQMWCENVRPEEERLRIVNEHAPERYRVNGVVSNFPEFRQAFGCSADDAMVRQNVCRVW